MGGVKNRDAKRATAKVFTSGGGGGTKGPAVVDKRGQEQECPHCERVFKQADRLKQHIEKQHAAADASEASSDSAAQAGGAAAAASSSSSSRPASSGPGSSRSLVEAAAAAAASTSAGSSAQGKQKQGPAAAAGSSSSAAAPAAAASGGRMFDVGSKGGFYTEKSPKLLLHEWCGQQKRPRPRYKAVPLGGDSRAGGGFKARVVLPDAKHPGSDKDTIVWLPADAATLDEEEALQRGAVAALLAVAGERSLDLVLPMRYRPLWRELKQAAAERAESQRRAAAAAAQAKERRAAATKAAAARAPVAVVMSEQQRQAVEGLMAELTDLDLGSGQQQPQAGGWPDDSSSSNAAAAGDDDDDDEETGTFLVDALIKAGFSAADASAAVRAVGPAAGRVAAEAAASASAAAVVGGRRATRVVRSHDGLQPYLDWLCLRLPVERLPARYRPGGSSGTVGVLRLNNSGRSSSLAGRAASGNAAAAAAAAGPGGGDDDSSSQAWADDPQVCELVSFGYPPAWAMDALAAARGDLPAALSRLQQQLTAGIADAPDSGAVFAGSLAADGVQLPQDWCDELEVLAAIYGDELQVGDGSSEGGRTPGQLSLRVQAADGGASTVQLHVWCPLAPQPYPASPPLLALSRCATLAAGQLLQLTVRLAAAAADALVGEPMVHGLAVALAEALEDEEQEQGSSRSHLLPPPFNQLPGAPASQQQQQSSGQEDDDGPESGFTSAAQQHAAAAEAILDDDDGAASSSSLGSSATAGSRGAASSTRTVSSSGRGGQQQGGRRSRPQMSPQQAAAESQRLAAYFRDLQADPRHASMRATRTKLPAAACRGDVLAAVAANDVVVISGQTGCGKSTQVPQFLLEAAAAAGRGGATNIIVCQPRRIAAVGLATRVAAEVGDPAGVGGLVGYSVRLETRASAATRLLFCTTGVLLRRLMGDPELAGVTHIVLDEVHERNLDSDLLLLLLRRALLLSRKQQSPDSSAPPKVLLMSATADAELFAGYFRTPGPGASLEAAASAAPPQKSSGSRHQQQLAVGLLSIPGFTHPVRQLWLEDALAQTGAVIGRSSRYAQRKAAKGGGGGGRPPAAAAGGGDDDDDEDDWDDEDDGDDVAAQLPQQAAAAGARQQQRGRQQPSRPPSAAKAPQAAAAAAAAAFGVGAGAPIPPGDAPSGPYPPDVAASLDIVDASIINFDLIEALLAHIASSLRARGPGALLQGWAGAPPGALEAAAAAAQRQQQRGGGAPCLGCVLVFMPGAPEIDRLVRQLQGSARLAGALGGVLRVLPLHGGLPPGVQGRVFEPGPPGGLKVVVATNVAETSLTIDDVTAVIDTGRHKEMSYDATRGLSRLAETWVSQASAQQRRGRAGRVAPGACYRLFPSAAWRRLAPQQPPEVLRVPLQALCLTTKAALAAALPDGAPQPRLADVLACLLTPPSPAAVTEALDALAAAGALTLPPPPAATTQLQQQQQQPADAEALTPLGRHLAAMPMDAPLAKALIYGCMLRCASPLLTIAAALAAGRPLWANPPPDKRGEAEAARRALAPQAFAQRSDHLALIAAFNGWLAARAAGGRSGGAAFARANFLNEAVLEGVAKGRCDFAATLASRGFLPGWYAGHLAQQQGGGGGRQQRGGSDSSGAAAAAAAEAAGPGGPDEFSGNGRVVKAAIAAGFYPRLLRVEAPAVYAQVAGGAVRTEADARAIRFFERGLGRVWLHPQSVCFKAGSYPSGWVVFTQLVETSRPFAREASMVPVYGLLALSGGALEVLHDQGLLLLDGWAKFKAPARVGVLIQHLRGAVASLLAAKVADPGLDLSQHKVVAALHSLLATDGF